MEEWVSLREMTFVCGEMICFFLWCIYVVFPSLIILIMYVQAGVVSEKI